MQQWRRMWSQPLEERAVNVIASTPSRRRRESAINSSCERNFKDQGQELEVVSYQDKPDDGSTVPESSTELNLPEVSIETQTKFLAEVYDGVRERFPELSFVMSRASLNSSDSSHVPFLTISQRQLFAHPPHGMVSRVQVSIQYKTYAIHVLMRLWKKESFDTVEEIVALCKTIGKDTQLKFCPGIEFEQ